jgi:hypothetical protein
MKKSALLLLVLFPATLFIAGCFKPLGNLSDINVNFNERVTVAARFENGDGLATIGSLSVTWDGQAFQDYASPSPAQQVAISGTRLGREAGTHRLSFRIANQTSSPNSYRVTGLVITAYDASGAVIESQTPDPKVGVLGTNDAIDYDFRL